MIFIFLIILHLYLPIIYYNHIDVSPDFFLLSIIFFSIKNNTYKIILAGLLFGFVNDLLISTNYFGAITILYMVFSYYLLRINIFKTHAIYNIFIILSFYIIIFLMYLLRYSDSYFFYIKYSLIKTLLIFLFLLLFDKIFGVSKKYVKR